MNSLETIDCNLDLVLMLKLCKRLLTSLDSSRLMIKRYPLLLGNTEERSHFVKEFGDKEWFWAPSLGFGEDGLTIMTPLIINRFFSLLQNFQENKVDIEKMCTPSLYKSIEWFHNYFDQENVKLNMSVQVKDQISRIRKQTLVLSIVDKNIDILDFGINAKSRIHSGHFMSENQENIITHGSSLVCLISFYYSCSSFPFEKR